MQPPLKEILQEARTLAPFPEVATRVLTLSQSPTVVPSELIEIVQVDPGLTAKILKLCNSAYYGFQREIASLEEAGNMLGVRALVNLVLTSSAGRYFRDYGSSDPSNQHNLWQESVTHAVASRVIADSSDSADQERAYTAGLLQNIGSLVLDRFYRQGQAYVTAIVAQGYPLVEAEKLALGLHHAELGARLMTRWDMPAVLTDTVRFHHNPEDATIDPVLTATVHLAETMAVARLNGENTAQLTYEVSDAALELTGLDPGDFDAIGVNLRGEMERAQAVLDL